MAATAGPPPSDPGDLGSGGPGPARDPMDAATEATRSLRGLSSELTARVPQLLEAMRTVGAGLELHVTLDRIVETAAELADARYAAIGIIDEAREGLSDFVTYGVTPQQHERIGALPDGHKVSWVRSSTTPSRCASTTSRRTPARPVSRRGIRRCGRSWGCRSGSRATSSATSI